MRAPGFRSGFCAPQVFLGGEPDIEAIGRVARRIEDLGYESIWTQELSPGSSATLEPTALLAYLAALTRRVRLGVAVYVLPLHDPVRLAGMLATVDRLSNGRLTVGVGLGEPGRHDLPLFHVPRDRRVRRFMEALGVMESFWTQETAGCDGEIWSFHDAPMGLKPLQRPRPPVWIGARAEPALRRAVRIADGWIGPGSSSIEDFHQHLAILREELERRDRDPSSFAISKRLYIAIDDDEDRAIRRLREWFAGHYGDAEMADRVAVWGPEDRCAERIEELIAGGAPHLVFNPVFDIDEHLGALAPYAGGA